MPQAGLRGTKESRGERRKGIEKERKGKKGEGGVKDDAAEEKSERETAEGEKNSQERAEQYAQADSKER